jgi:hypothetical protein
MPAVGLSPPFVRRAEHRISVRGADIIDQTHTR